MRTGWLLVVLVEAGCVGVEGESWNGESRDREGKAVPQRVGDGEGAMSG